MKTTEQFTYKAFISYSHAADGKVAPALQSALHKFAKPWYKLRAMRMFRDETNLAVNPHLWSTIVEALDDSEFFILLASPQAAQSHWVPKEVDHWLSKRPPETLLIVLTDGEIVWDQAAGDFDWTKTTALPRNLSKVFSEEPLYLDFRAMRTQADLSLRNPDFLNKIARIAAPLHGRSLDDLIGEDVRQHRKFKIVAWTAGIIIFIFALIATREAIVANQRYQIALSRQLAAQAKLERDSTGELGTSLVHSMLLSIEALRRYPIPEAIHVLSQSSVISPRLLLSNIRGRAITISPGGKWLAVNNLEGSVEFWETATSKMVSTLDFKNKDIGEISLSDNGKRFAFVEARNEIVTLKVMDITSGLEIASFPQLQGVSSVALNNEGALLAVGWGGKSLAIFEVESGRALAHVKLSRSPGALAFSEDQKHVAALVAGTVRLWEVQTGKELGSPQDVRWLEDEGDDRSVYTLTGDGRSVGTGKSDGTVQVWDVATRREIARMEGGAGAWVELSANGKVVATGDKYDYLDVWSIDSPSEIVFQTTQEKDSRRQVKTIAISSDGRRVGIGWADGTVDLRETPTGRQFSMVKHEGNLQVIALSSNGEYLVTADSYDSIRLWSVETGHELRVLKMSAKDFGGEIMGIALSGDGKRVAVGGDFHTLAVYGIQTEEQLLRLQPYRSSGGDGILSFNLGPDGKWLITGSDEGGIQLWNVDRRNKIVGPDLGKPVQAVALSADNKWFAATTEDRVLRVWEMDAGHEVARLDLNGDTRSLAFSPDGKWLIAVGWDGRVDKRPWQIQDLINDACSRLRRNFGPKGWARYFGDEPYRKTCPNLP